MPHFEMLIEEVTQRGGARKVLVTGKVSSGEVRTGDPLIIHTASATLPVVVEDLFGFSPISVFVVGDNAALLLGNVTKAEIPNGSRLTGD